MVDKVPATLKKGMKKEDAEKVKEKLETLKCTIKLLWNNKYNIEFICFKKLS